MNNNAWELNIDGLVGPTHNYAGLGEGNLASKANVDQTSKPKEAALEGLKKMKFCHDMGLKQAVMPPAFRPDLQLARQLGYRGTDEYILSKLVKADRKLLKAITSASSMWTANAATVSPSADTNDAKVHFTVANLQQNFHRSIEAPFYESLFNVLFSDRDYFNCHPALLAHADYGDEGAANHMRLCSDYGQPGVELFVYGDNQFQKRYQARQNQAASRAIIRQHQLENVLLIKQNPEVIDAGVFHNDVIAVSNKNCLFLHQEAWYDQHAILYLLRERCDYKLNIIEVSSEQLSVKEAVDSYLFNSQIVSVGEETHLILPAKCREYPAVMSVLDQQFEHCHFFNLQQSMRNGGGPACLRLRVELREEELAAMHQDILLTDRLYDLLVDWVQQHYRETLTIQDLSDPHLVEESKQALDKLTDILNLGSIYPFQK